MHTASYTLVYKVIFRGGGRLVCIPKFIFSPKRSYCCQHVPLASLAQSLAPVYFATSWAEYPRPFAGLDPLHWYPVLQLRHSVLGLLVVVVGVALAVALVDQILPLVLDRLEEHQILQLVLDRLEEHQILQLVLDRLEEHQNQRRCRIRQSLPHQQQKLPPPE